MCPDPGHYIDSWLAYPRSLTARRLSGVELVTSDAHVGLLAGIGGTLPRGVLAFAVGQRPSPAATRMETAGQSVRTNAFATATVRESPVAWKAQPCPGALYPKAGIGHFRSQTERC
jgi:hypothetical protein